MIFTLGSGHRVDDGLDALESALVHLRILGEVSERPKFRQHADDLLERAHLAQLAQLVAKVFEGELVPPQLALELRGFLGIDGLLGLLDQRHHVAHAEHARHDAVRIKRFQRVVLLADAHEFHRRAGYLADRKCRAAAGVAIELGQHYPG